MAVTKDDFDISLIPGARAALDEAYREFRKAEEAHYACSFETVTNSAAANLRVRDCPLCGERDSTPFLAARNLDIVRCCRCGHIYSREVYSEECEAQRYASLETGIWDAYLTLKRQPVLSRTERLKNIYYLELCEKFVPIGNMLEIGSGSGGFLLEAKRRGWNAIGVDPNPVWQQIDPQCGVSPIPGRFPDVLPPSKTYDCIAMLDVLEHMADPADLLRATSRRLNPDGVVFVQVPNVNSLAIRLEGAANTTFCPGHWSYFDATSLSHLAKECGFDVVRIETVITEMDRIGRFSHDQVARTVRALTSQPMDELTPAWMHDNLLGYKLVCVLHRKR